MPIRMNVDTYKTVFWKKYFGEEREKRLHDVTSTTVSGQD